MGLLVLCPAFSNPVVFVHQAEFTGLQREDDSKVSLTLGAKPAAPPKDAVC